MLDILELLGRVLVGAMRVADFVVALIDTGFGFYWLFSPKYREQVRAADVSTKLSVYTGVFLLLILIGALVWIGLSLKTR
ncbi:hypothetical protein BH09VER1_BH09VER1_48140 [soil metagenome]